MAKTYEIPEWFLEGNIGVRAHWGAPNYIDEESPHHRRRLHGSNKDATASQGDNKQEYSHESGIRFTITDGKLSPFVLAPPTNDIVIKTLTKEIRPEQSITRITLMGRDEKIIGTQTSEGLRVRHPAARPCASLTRFELTIKSNAKFMNIKRITTKSFPAVTVSPGLAHVSAGRATDSLNKNGRIAAACPPEMELLGSKENMQ